MMSTYLAAVEKGPYDRRLKAVTGEGARPRISTNGGWSPRWSPDRETLYYMSLDGTLIGASLQTDPEVRVTERVGLFGGVTKSLRKTSSLSIYGVTSRRRRHSNRGTRRGKRRLLGRDE